MDRKIKVVYIISNINKALAFEWIVNSINNTRFELEFILLSPKNTQLYAWLKSNHVRATEIKYRGKKDLFKAFFNILKILRKSKPNIVHSHLLDANLIGLSAAKIAGIEKRIYTRHHSTYHHDFYRNGIKYDLFTNKLATDVVAISENVKDILIQMENVPEEKIHLVRHGFDLKEFGEIDPPTLLELRNKYNITDNTYPTIGVISRLIEWKGVNYIVEAFNKLLSAHPNAKLLIANASGPQKPAIESALSKIPTKNYQLIAFEENIFGLYHLFDIYVHTPIDAKIEAFGQTYIEALAAGVPSIFTLSGIANEFIKNDHNAVVVDYKNPDEIYNQMINLIKDEPLRKRIIENGKKSIAPYSLDTFIQSLESLYSINSN